MVTRVTATRAARGFAELLDRVRYRGESFVVERAGEPVCRIGPAEPVRCTGADLVGVLASLPHPGDDYLDALEALQRRQARLPRTSWRR